MTDDEIRAHLEAEAQHIAEHFQFDTPPDRRADLDQARTMYEAITGQPCIASYDGDRIIVQTPVINRSAIRSDDRTNT